MKKSPHICLRDDCPQYPSHRSSPEHRTDFLEYACQDALAVIPDGRNESWNIRERSLMIEQSLRRLLPEYILWERESRRILQLLLYPQRGPVGIFLEDSTNILKRFSKE